MNIASLTWPCFLRHQPPIKSMTIDDTFQRLNQETAKISWQELQHYYASGNMIEIDTELDLVKTGVEIVNDNKALIESMINNHKIKPVDDNQATLWLESNQILWALVVKPWILVQRPKTD